MTTAFARAIEGIPVFGSTAERDLVFPVPQRDQRYQDRTSGDIWTYDGVMWSRTQRSNNSSVLSLSRYTVGNGVADDTIGIQQWYAAIPDGGTGLVPLGGYRFTSKLSWNRNVNIIGEGPGSAFIPDVGAASDGIVVNDTVGAHLYRIQLTGFSVLSATVNCCRNAFVLNRVHNADDINVHVKAKAVLAGTVFNGCLSNRRVLIVTSNNYAYPWPASMPLTDSVRLVFDTVNTVACNANDFCFIIEGGTGNGLYIDDQHAFGVNTIRGVIELGSGGGAYTLYAKNCQGLRICDFYGESGAVSAVTLENCTEAAVGPNFELFGQSLNIIGTSRHCRLDGVFTDSLTVAATCDRIEVGNLTYNIVNGLGVISDPGDKIVYTGTVVNAANAATMAVAGGPPSDGAGLFVNASLERWPGGDAATPGGFSFIQNAPAYVKCGTGLGDATRDYTRYCAKVTTALAGDAPAIPLDWTVASGEWVTIFARIKVPAGQPNVSLRTFFDGGATVRVGETVTTKDAFVWISTSFFAASTFASALGVLMPAAAGTFYISHFGYAIGHRRPRRLWAHPSMDQGERVLDGRGETLVAAMPAAGIYRQGDIAWLNTPAAQTGVFGTYFLLGWMRLTTGAAHVLNTDWAEIRYLNGAGVVAIPGTSIIAPWTFSAGADATSTLQLGAGGAAPTALRTALFILDAPHSGGFTGSANIRFRRAGTELYNVGLNSAGVSGIKSAITDFYIFDSVNAAYLVAVTQGSGRLSAKGAVVGACSRPAYSAAITIDASLGNVAQITANNNTAFTINAPTNPVDGQLLRVRIRNTSGGALGVATWAAAFKMGAAWVQPANGFSRSIDFEYDSVNVVWIEANRSAADVNN